MKIALFIIGILFISLIALFFFVIYLKKQCDAHETLIEQLIDENQMFQSEINPIAFDEGYYDEMWENEN